MILKKLAIIFCITLFALFVRSQSSVALAPPIFPVPVRFPNGIKALADHVHSKGLKPGIYSDAAALTCDGVTGSYNFEECDATTFAKWGIDYLKYDYCNAPGDMVTAFTGPGGCQALKQLRRINRTRLRNICAGHNEFIDKVMPSFARRLGLYC